MRRVFAAVHCKAAVPDAAPRAAELAAALDRDGRWRKAGAGGGWSVWTGSAAAFGLRRLPRDAGLLVGDVFETPGGAQEAPQRAEAAEGDLVGVASGLSRTYWGHYVALLDGPDGGVFRDPSGMVDAWVWPAHEGVAVAASDLVGLPSGVGPRRLALNWDRIGRFLAAPPSNTSAALFDGVRALGPGELLTLGGREAASISIWSPVRFAKAPVADPVAARRAIRRRVDQSVQALVGGYDRVLVELSGGLDSSILAGSIQALGLAPRVGQWLNGTYGRPEADEDRYARAVTDRLGVALATVRRTPDGLQETDLAEVAGAAWPAMDGVDAGRDRDEARRLREGGMAAIVSGQGGDGAFFQMPSALVAADELRRRGPAALTSQVLADVARRTRKSVWAVLREGRAAAAGRPPGDFTSSLVSDDLRRATRGRAHPWVIEAIEAGLPPGKILHVQAASNLQTYHGPSRRRREADLLLPLAAQPVLELCLAIPTPDLAGGNYDRPFARRVFADRLPELVLNRRAKGIVSVYFARLVANSLPLLRPYLLDGCLCAAGLLDRRVLERALDPAQLIWDVRAADVLWAATVEAWARHWQGRIPDSAAAPRRQA